MSDKLYSLSLPPRRDISEHHDKLKHVGHVANAG